MSGFSRTVIAQTEFASRLPLLKEGDAAVVVAVTHLAIADDRALGEKYPEIDLVIGGHEHYLITTTENRSLISKAGSDASFVARIDVNQRPSGTVERFYELLPITSALPDESKTAAAIASFESRLSTALGETVGATRVPLDGVSLHLRASETNLGNFFADAIRADANADIAITNAGSIRGDRMFPAGPLTRRTLVEIHSFGNVVCVHGLPGRVVLQALEHGVSSLAVSDGRFPQVSGLTMIVDRKAPAGSRVRDVKVSRRESRNGASGREPNHASLNQRRRAGHTRAGNQARSRSRRSRSSIVSTS